MNSSPRKTIITLSESSDDEELPLLERILQFRSEGFKNEIRDASSPKYVHSSKAHTISDSEESDSEVKESMDINLPEQCHLPSQHSISPLPCSINFHDDDPKPLFVLDVVLSDEEFRGPNDKADKIDSEVEQPQSKKSRKAASKNAQDNVKEEVKAQKLKLKEEKKKEKEFAKALKASEKEILKSQKPEECIKNMKIVIDHNIMFQDESQAVFSALECNNLQYSIEENAFMFSVVWYRAVTDVKVENYQVLKEECEKQENILILFIPNEKFLHMVHASSQEAKGKSNGALTLLDHISSIKSVFPEMDVTCVIAGFNQYVREIKEGPKSAELKTMVKQLPKTTTEEVITEVQLQACVNFHFLNNMAEFGNLLCRFTKAIAEAPQRNEKFVQKSLAFSWYADADSSCPVKTTKDGSGLMKLWQQQIQQFQNVGPEVAEAIASKYPSPQLLQKAYRNCGSTKEAEMLLKDIVVRRNYGPLGTQRRIGPELSFKIYLFFTSWDGNQILQR